MKKVSYGVAGIAASITTILLFQNCSGGFNATQTVDLSSLTSGTSAASKPWTCNAGDPGKQEKESRRLASPEIIASLRVVFGNDILTTKKVQESFAALPSESFFGLQNGYDFETKSIEGLLQVSEAVADVVFNVAGKSQAALNCNADTEQAKCEQNLLGDVGTKIFRRPLSATEKLDYQQFVKSIGGKEGLKWALIRMLASPQFSHILETSTDMMSAGRYKLTQFELASRISFRLTGAGPDTELLNAAAKSELSQLSQIKAQAQRLLKTAPAQERTKEMIRNWLDKKSVGDPNPNVAAALGIAPTGFGKELMTEFNMFLDDVIFKQDGSYRDLITSKTAFPYTDRVAKLYNLSRSDAPQKFTDGRGGIVLRGATLASSQAFSDPISRGVYVRRKVLCQIIPFPNAAVVAEREKEQGVVDRLKDSNRTIVTNLTSSQSCMGCHSSINPIGFALEEFGPMGEARTAEKIYDVSGRTLAQHALNLNVADLSVDYDKRSPSSSAGDLTSAISESMNGKICFAKQVFAQSRFRFPELSGDGCAMNQIYEKINNGLSVQEILVENVANEDIFWRSASN